jgi:predicted ribonuclease YlaK
MKISDMYEFEALTDNQKKAKDAWDEGSNLVLSGSAGTGKTYLGMYFALETVFTKNNYIDKVVIIRSIVPTREIGYLPGSKEEKESPYTLPYADICDEIIDTRDSYSKLILQGKAEFLSTSFIRGTTFDNCVVLVDEMQNLNFHELDSVITRVGENCKLIFCGDYYQSDFEKERDKNGLIEFLNILDQTTYFETIEFTWKDIVRSDLVREYIMTKEMLR